MEIDSAGKTGPGPGKTALKRGKMNIINYLQPENLIALYIVYALWIIFSLWLGNLIYSCLFIARQRKLIRQCSDVDGLANEMAKILRIGEEEEEQKPKRGRRKKKDETEESVDWTARLKEGKKAFLAFCSKKNLREKNIVNRHIKAIFEAGLQDSRLDVGELLKHSNSELFRGNSLLKSMLASFIVLGLLGTLVGLADSLAGLSPVLGKNAVGQTSEELSSGLSLLFGHLKSAFAPSIWGVGLTVLGVILFSLYLHLFCHPLKNILEHTTLVTWVPKLYLTTSQRLLGTLKSGEEQIQKNIEGISNLVKAGDTIKDNAVELSENLEKSNDTLVAMIDSASGMKAFTDSFVTGVDKLSSFQTELTKLYDQMAEDSDHFQMRIRKSIESSQAFQNKAAETFAIQNKQLQESYENLKDLAERNDRMINKVGEPIVKGLDDIEHKLAVGLDDISKRFDTFDVPIRKASDKMAISVENFDKRTQDFKNEINKDLNQLFDRVEAYSNRLSDANLSQAEYAKVLAENASALGGKIESLDSSFKNFAQFIQAEKEETGKLMKTFTEDLKEEFTQQNRENNKNVEKLFNRFENYDDELTAARRDQVKYAETLDQKLTSLTETLVSLEKGIQTLEKVFQQRDESMERLQALGALSDQMGGLVHHLRTSSKMQEDQNKVMGRRLDQMTEAVNALAKGLSEKGGMKVPKIITDDKTLTTGVKQRGFWAWLRGLFRRRR